MTQHPTRRRTALAAAALLAVPLAGCADDGSEATAPPPGATADAAPAATAPALGAAAWLTGQLEDGLLVGQYGPDFGLSIDTALGLAELGHEGHQEHVAAVADAVAAKIDSYTTGVDFGSEDVYAGSVAKATVLTQVAGRDATDVGGRDLVALLEERVADDGPAAGRLSDEVTSADGADYANAIGQAWAVQALRAAGSPEAETATDYLLAQQCEEGWFRLALGPADAEGSCAEGEESSLPDTDVTALAVLALAADPSAEQEEESEDAAEEAVDAAVDWLAGTQGKDGGFGGATSTEGVNANSTGLAGWALMRAGRTAEAEKAAQWLVERQVVDLDCSARPVSAVTGAVAYDDAGLKAVTATLEGETRDQWRRATAQAVPVLALTGEPAGEVTVEVARREVTVSGLGTGEVACLRGPGRLTRPVVGTGDPVAVELPAAAGKPSKYTLHRLAGPAVGVAAAPDGA